MEIGMLKKMKKKYESQFNLSNGTLFKNKNNHSNFA